MSDGRKNFVLGVSAIVFLALAASLAFIQLKSSALAFQPQDYSFYLQYAAKLLDPGLTDRVSLNPEGYNFFGFTGSEAPGRFHVSLHLEPVKYLYPWLYTPFQNSLPVFALIAAVYLFPVLYIARFQPLRDQRDRWFCVLLALFYVLFPSTLQSIAQDLRPRHFLAPFFILAVLSVHYRRPRLERLALFNGMFLAREEALVLSWVVILYDYLRSGKQGKTGRATIPLLACWFAWLSLSLAYFTWTGYAVDPYISPFAVISENPAAGALLGAAAVLVSGVVLWLARKREALADRMQVLLYSLVFLPLLWQLIRDEGGLISRLASGGSAGLVGDMVADPKWNLLLAAFIALLALAWDAAQSKAARRGIMVVLVGGIAGGTLTSAWLLNRQVSAYQARRAAAQPVWELRAATDRYHTNILTDYAAYQAFADYENVFVYNRLPWDWIKGKGRYYPQNQNALIELLKNRIEFVVISGESEDELAPLLSAAGIQPLPTGGNRDYLIYSLP